MANTAITKDGGPSRQDMLGVYLNDHLAGATAGSELASRMTRSHRGREEGVPLSRLAVEIAQDRSALLNIMASLGIAVSTIGRVLNHAPTGVTSRVYDKFSYAGEKRRALETWAHKLTSIVAPAPAAVADLAKARAARARV